MSLPWTKPAAWIGAQNQENPAPKKTRPDQLPSGGGLLPLATPDRLRNAAEDLGGPDLEISGPILTPP